LSRTAPTSTTKTISVLIYGDRLREPDETFQVRLSNAINAAIVSGVGTGTIRNDD
jgi:large repetitive protein